VVSDDGGTTTLLLRMGDGTLIETVLMQYPEPGERHPRSTVCVSTQAGCAMGCVFCATGQMGFERNLKAEEIVTQVLHIDRLLRERGEHVTNVVFMGMGEPLANYAEDLPLRPPPQPTPGVRPRPAPRHLSTVGLIHAIGPPRPRGPAGGTRHSRPRPNDAVRRVSCPPQGPPP